MNIQTIPIQSGTSFYLHAGALLKVICPHGEQVADLVAFSKHNIAEHISNGKTFDYEETIRLTTGNQLYSNQSSIFLEIIEDTCGTHDFLLSPCCQNTFKHFYEKENDHPSCLGNLHHHLQSYGISKDQIPTAFNIFMNVPVTANGHLSVQPPKAKPGDFIIFKAKQDLIIGLTACSAYDSNNGTFKTIQYQILDKNPIE